MAEAMGVVLEFGASTDQLDQGTDKAVQDVEKFEASLADVVRQLEQMQRAVVEGFIDVENAIRGPQEEVDDLKGKTSQLTAAIKGAIAGFLTFQSLKMSIEWAQRMGAAAQELDNLSQQFGINVEKLSQWQAVVRSSGGSTQTLTGALGTLSKNLENARAGAEEQAAAFQILGINVDTVKDSSELMLQIADRFSTMPDGPEKTALAMKLLGNSGASLIPIFNKGGDAIEDAMQAAAESGAAVSEEFVAAGLAVDEAFTSINSAVTGLTNNIFEALAPAIADLANGFAQWIEDMNTSGEGATWLQAILTALSVVLKTLGVVISTVSVIINDVWTAALLVLIPPLQLVKTLIISIGRALQGDFGGALGAWSEGVDDAVSAMSRQLEKAKQVRGNYAKFIADLADDTTKTQTGGPTPNEEGEARLAALKARQAELERQRIERERAQKLRAAQQIAREQERLAREQAAYEIEMLENKQAAVEDDFAAWNDLQEQKLAIIRRVYGEESRQYQAMLGEQQRAQRDALIQEQEIRMTGAQGERDIMAIKLQSARDAGAQRIQIERDNLAQMRALGQLTAAEELAANAALDQREIEMERNLQANLFALQMEGLRAELDVIGLKATERAKINADIERLQAEHNARMAELDGQAAAAHSASQTQMLNDTVASYQAITQPIGGAINGMFQNLYNGTMGFKDALLKAADQILFSFVNMGIQMAAEWAAQELAKSAATAAGVATRTTTEAAGAATTQAISAETALFQIANYAWTAAAGAYAALAAIPVIGPVLAPAAALAAVAAVLGFAGSIASAEGGWGRVPKDGMMTKLHEDEMVLPADLATPLRDMLGGWGPQSNSRELSSATSERIQASGRLPGATYVEGDTNLSYAPVANVSNRSLNQQLRSEAMQMRKWLKNQARNGALQNKGNVS